MTPLEILITIILTIVIGVLIPSKWKSTVKCYSKYIFFFVYFAIISVIGFPLCMKHPANCKSMWVYATLMTPASWMLGIKWDLRNGDKLIGQERSAVCVANHQSMYDIVGMLLLWKTYSFRCGIVARNFFFWLWPVGLAMWLSGIIFIKRQSGSEKTKQGFNEAANQLFKNKEKLWIFVEGTRNKNPERLLPFKKGAFVTAIKYQVPIQPVLFSPFYFIDLKNKRFDSGKVIIEVMDPISTEGLTLNDLDDLIAKTYAIMSEKYEELKDEIKKYTKNDEQKGSYDLGVAGS